MPQIKTRCQGVENSSPFVSENFQIVFFNANIASRTSFCKWAAARASPAGIIRVDIVHLISLLFGVAHSSTALHD